MPDDRPTLAAFDALFEAARATGGAIDYRLAAPRWQFLCHLADTRDIVLHGSGNPAIAEFEPRKADDVNAFGDRKAVYAAGDGLWPMYFAILDRERFPMSLINSATRMELGEGRRSEPWYFFSISATALAQRPFRRGTVYLLPRTTFEQQAPIAFGGRTVRVPQWASLSPVRPLARLDVGPEDFPLLAQLRGHDDEVTFARARANPDGFPWLDAEAGA
jgi:hypothetical protein